MKSIIFFLEFEGRILVIDMAPHTGAKRYAGPRTFFSTVARAPVAPVESAPMMTYAPYRIKIKRVLNSLGGTSIILEDCAGVIGITLPSAI